MATVIVTDTATFVQRFLVVIAHPRKKTPRHGHDVYCSLVTCSLVTFVSYLFLRRR